MKFTSLQDPVFLKFWYSSNVVALITWILTIINHNFSQIDRLWSILPIVYSWGFLFTAIYFNPGPEPAVQIISENNKEDLKYSTGSGVILESDNSSIMRIVIIAIFITMWGSRLTYNFWRKGGYQKGSEDYRWVHVKKMFSYPETKWKFHLFNLGFIAFFQSWLLLSLTLPLWFIQTNKLSRSSSKQEPFNCLDAILSLIWLSFYTIEVIADRQQFDFQTKKYKYLSLSIKNKKIFKENSNEAEMADIKRGFLTRGLFKYSRHPNFFGELGMWWTIAAFTISSQYTQLIKNFNYMNFLPSNYAFLGIICLTLLFNASTDLTEKISISKYTEYKQYKNKVNRLIMWFPGEIDKKD